MTRVSQYAVRRDTVQRAEDGRLSELAGWVCEGDATHLTRQESWWRTATRALVVIDLLESVAETGKQVALEAIGVGSGGRAINEAVVGRGGESGCERVVPRAVGVGSSVVVVVAGRGGGVRTRASLS